MSDRFPYHAEDEFDAFPCVWLFDEGKLPEVPERPDERLEALREAARSPDGRILCRQLFAVLRAEAEERRGRIGGGEPAATLLFASSELKVADLLVDLCSPRGERRIGAVEELYGLEAFSLQDGLVRCLEKDVLRWLSAQALVALQARVILPDLDLMTYSDDAEVRFIARCAIAYLANESEVDLVIRGIWDDDASRFASLRGLRRVLALAPGQVAPKAIEPLTFLVEDQRDLVRAAAAQLLGELAEVFPTPALRKALPALKRRGSFLPWASRGASPDAVARRECRDAAARIQQALKGRADLPLPVINSLEQAPNLPRPSGAGNTPA